MPEWLVAEGKDNGGLKSKKQDAGTIRNRYAAVSLLLRIMYKKNKDWHSRGR